jgi:tetratricopeptide (TPR) repeat protein
LLLAQACIAGPGGAVQPATVRRWAELAAAKERPRAGDSAGYAIDRRGPGASVTAIFRSIQKSQGVRTVGAALYRAGEYEKAVAFYKDLEQVTVLRGIDRLFLALAEHNLGRHAEAGEQWNRALEWLDHNPADLRWKDPAVKDNKWEGIVPIECLRREAEEILGTTPSAADLLKRAGPLGSTGLYLRGLAARDYAKALEQMPPEWGWNSPRQSVCRRIAASPSDIFERVVELRPGDTDLQIGRGRCLIWYTKLSMALREYATVIASRPLDDDSFEYACLLHLVGDEEGRAGWLKQMAARGSTSKDRRVKYVLARSFAIAPTNVVPPEQVVQWAGQAADADAPAWVVHTLALAHYRAGQFEEAVRQAAESSKREWGEVEKGQNELVLAMALHKLGRVGEARQHLEKARAALEPKQKPGQYELFPPAPPDFLTVRILRPEAEKLLDQEGPKEQ